MARKKQGYNARKDESLGTRRKPKRKSKQSYKSRRKESAGEEKALKRRKYASVKTMDKKRKTKAKPKKKKKLNPYFQAMLKARRSNASSFTYNGTTYVAVKNKKTGMSMYKKK